MPVWWTKRSLPGSSGVMKPKPLSSLNHLTVPVASLASLLGLSVLRSRRGAHEATTRTLARLGSGGDPRCGREKHSDAARRAHARRAATAARAGREGRPARARSARQAAWGLAVATR